MAICENYSIRRSRAQEIGIHKALGVPTCLLKVFAGKKDTGCHANPNDPSSCSYHSQNKRDR